MILIFTILSFHAAGGGAAPPGCASGCKFTNCIGTKYTHVLYRALYPLPTYQLFYSSTLLFLYSYIILQLFYHYFFLPLPASSFSLLSPLHAIFWTACGICAPGKTLKWCLVSYLCILYKQALYSPLYM